MFDPAIVRGALVESVRKLDPRVQARNPVMFVVVVGSCSPRSSSSATRRVDRARTSSAA